MTTFCEHQDDFQRYPEHIITTPRTSEWSTFTCLEWGDNLGLDDRCITVSSIQEILQREATSPCRLRAIFLPITPCKGDQEERKGFQDLFEHYSFPSVVLAERMRSASHACGVAELPGASGEIAWFHFLCRNPKTTTIKTEITGEEQLHIEDLGYARKDPRAISMWVMCDFFLHVRRDPSDQEQAATVTLLCFGAPSEVFERFAALIPSPGWKGCMEEPSLLFDIIFDELHGIFDRAAWRLGAAIRPVEELTLHEASTEEQKTCNIDFKLLHNAQKNCIFMIEAADASMATLDAMTVDLQEIRSKKTSFLTTAAIRKLRYRRRSFHATRLRLQSLEKRMSNMIELSFHLVTQSDSRMMMHDSQAMKVIAVLTFVFFPTTGVASVFSMPYFDIDWRQPDKLNVASSLWIFWAVTIPLTAVAVMSWVGWSNLVGWKMNGMKPLSGNQSRTNRFRLFVSKSSDSQRFVSNQC